MRLTQNINTNLATLLEQNIVLKKNLLAVYQFGSTVKGRSGKRSDIDLALVFDYAFYNFDPFIALQEAEILAATLSNKILRPLDIVVLNGASLSFAYHTLKGGKCIYERNSADRILYEVAIDNKYQDFAPFLEELRALKRSFLVGRD